MMFNDCVYISNIRYFMMLMRETFHDDKQSKTMVLLLLIEMKKIKKCKYPLMNYTLILKYDEMQGKLAK